MRRIKLTQGRWATIDDQDYELVSLYKWCVDIRSSTLAYAATGTSKNGKRSSLRMHQLLLTVPSGYEVDHIDGNGLNNQRDNLRIATRAQQSWNAKAHRKHLPKGVTYQKRLKKRPWQARIGYQGKQIHLGYFKTAAEAGHAFNLAAQRLCKDFARVNKDVATTLSDNGVRQVTLTQTSVYKHKGKNGRRSGHIDVTMSCGHTKRLSIGQASKVGKTTHCQECIK